MNTKKNNRKEKRGNHNVLNIFSSTTTFPKYPSRDPTEPTSLQSSSLYKIQKLSKLRCPSSLLEQKKRKEKRIAKEKKKSHRKRLEKITRGRVFIETSVATGWHVRFIYDAIEPLPINPSTSRVSCEGGTKAASADRYRADITTISRRSYRRVEISTVGVEKKSENVFQGKNYDRLAGIGYVCALDGDSFILSKTDVSFKERERDNLIIIVYLTRMWMDLIHKINTLTSNSILYVKCIVLY